MRCDEFARHLDAYLNGTAGEPLLGELVDHEAGCGPCHRLAVERQASAAPEASCPAESTPASEGSPTRALLDSVLSRTTGEDCLYMEQRLAERLDEPLDPGVESRLLDHLRGCAECRRVRDVLEELPSWYEAMVVPKADRAFTREVLRRTTGREPGFLEVWRALWGRPEAIWEAAAACALVTMLLFGGPARSPVAQPPVSAVEAGLRGLGESLNGGMIAVRGETFRWVNPPLRTVRSGWERFSGRMAGLSDWMEQTSRDLREMDSQGLWRDFNPVLERLGISNIHEPGGNRDPSKPGRGGKEWS